MSQSFLGNGFCASISTNSSMHTCMLCLQHIFNCFMMVGELLMNRMPFFDHLQGTVGLWIASYIFYGFFYRLRTGLWVYPVRKTNVISASFPVEFELCLFTTMCCLIRYNVLTKKALCEMYAGLKDNRDLVSYRLWRHVRSSFACFQVVPFVPQGEDKEILDSG